MPSADDPLDWTVDQVVEFLCHSQKTPWSQSTTPPPRPDPATFEDALRSNMITGETLLNDIDKQTLREDLGLKKIGYWSTILMAIRYLRSISRKYQRQLQNPSLVEQSPSIFVPEEPRVDSSVAVNGGATQPSGLSTSSPPGNSVESAVPDPHLRACEHYVVDQQGRKRRKLNLEDATPQAPITDLVPKPDVISPARDKTWYIGPNKISPAELFYPLALNDDDEEDTFVMCSPNFPTGQRLFVREQLHHFYFQRPISLGSNDGISKWAVIPYNHTSVENNRQNYFTLYSLKDGKVTVRQENVDKWPQLSTKVTTQDDSTALKFSDPFSYLIQKYPVQEGNEEAYPLYGDSGSEGVYDEETWLEIENEQQEPHQGKQERLSAAEVDLIIAKCVNDMEETWHQDHQPKEERKARRLWLTARRFNSTNQQIKVISRDIFLLERRLRKIQGAIRESDYATVSELQMQCQSMQQTVFNIQVQKWRISILEQAVCPPRVVDIPKRLPAPKPKPNLEDGESLYSESDGDSGSLDDFIDDDTVINGDIYNGQVLPGSPPREAHNLQAEETSDILPQSHISPSSSDSDAILTPSATRRKSRKQSTVLRQEDRKAWHATVPIEPGSPMHEDAISPEPNNLADIECIDLTGDSPPEVDDLRIETPPLNPSLPKMLNSAQKKVKIERGPSTSPPPDLGLSVFVEISNRKTTDDGRLRDTKTADIDFAGISRMDWESLEERRDRRRILAKLVKGLPRAEQENMTKRIPHYISGLLRKHVLSALKAFSNHHDKIRGVDDEDQELVKRTASLYVSWVNCKHYEQEGLPKKDVTEAKKDQRSFTPFHKALTHCLVEFEKWTRSKGSGTQAEQASSGDELSALSSIPHKKRKREVKESQEVKRTHETAQLRVAIQDRQKRRLERKLESMGLNNNDPTHQAVSFGNPIIYLDPHIGRRIKPHQLNGVQFMWRELIEDEKRHGCVLAHTMGLGKTMQVWTRISLLVTISAAATSPDQNVAQQVPSCFHRSQTLILCPSSLIENWYEEFLMWSPKENHLGPLRKITSSSAVADRLQELFSWDEEGGILIMSYDIFRIWILNKETKSRGKPLQDACHERVRQCLLVGPNIIVADEAHKMKNRASGIATATSEFRSKSRIALTGSPLANNLGDYYSMVDWISPGYLGNSVEFRANYIEPIEEGLYADSSHRERRKSLVKLQVLKEILSPKVNRADISVLAGSLPPKVEFVITVSLTDLQNKAYNSEKLLSHANDAAKLSRKSEDFDNDVVPGDEPIVQAGLPETVVTNQEELFSAVPDMKALDLSYRAQILDRIVTESINAGDKVLVFSHSLPTLDYIDRQAATKRFSTIGSEQVYLISTRAGGLGLNIPGANRVVIFDFSFSPVWEEQAVGRAYRLGQQKPVFVYRFLAGGTFEEVIYNKAIFKTQLAFRVVDKKNPVRWASRSLGEYLFPVKEVERQNISEYVGKDPQVLDKIIADDHEGVIRKIALTETFQKEDNDKLTEEEKQGVQKEIEDEQLKRTDPVAYEKLMRERQQEEAMRIGATMSNLGTSYHYAAYGSYATQPHPQYSSTQYMPSMARNYLHQAPAYVPASTHSPGPLPSASNASGVQSPSTRATTVPGTRPSTELARSQDQSPSSAPAVAPLANPTSEKPAPVDVSSGVLNDAPVSKTGNSTSAKDASAEARDIPASRPCTQQ
ncbi:hypothetical protein MPDQ_002646 [Monascus purpureus]|uniref:SNF2 family helicase/ATPase n=1 Tax=Monascus purpureus TaxID=5098 RepID=A0A507QM25_MONPU|nr:hypothetical protein MPDQ_002646 [Monascus purpureus]